MTDAARLSRLSYLAKPSGVSYTHFKPSAADVTTIAATVNDAIEASAYSALISYAEALSSLQNKSVAWSIIRLYYSCFYSIRSLLLLNKIIPFNGNEEMILDVVESTFHKGGKSSHHWNWGSITKVNRLKTSWFTSNESQETYQKIREFRENVNYTHGFTDPHLHECLISGESDLTKRFRTYRDDDAFLYTYLSDHLALAYPTKLIFALEDAMKSASIELDEEKISHAKRVWKLKERCPLC